MNFLDSQVGRSPFVVRTVKAHREPLGLKRLFGSEAVARRRRLRVQLELLEDRVAPAAGAWSALGAVPAQVSNLSSIQAADAGASYVEQAKLMTATPAESARFGSSVSLTSDGEMLAVGAPNGGPGVEPQSVAVFTRSNRVWTQVAEIPPPAGVAESGRFGVAVAISGDGSTLAVSSRVGYTDHDSASLHVYARSGSEWNLVQTVSMVDGGGFGASLAISDDGGVIVGGASRVNVGDNERQGAVFAFTRADGVYSQGPAIIASSGEAIDLFGESIALSGDGTTLAVSAPGANLENSGGVVFVYERSGVDWNLVETLTRPGFGFSGPVAVSGDGSVLLVGGTMVQVEGVNTRAVLVYTKSGSTWTQSDALTTSDESQSTGFGVTVALTDDGATAVVGSPDAWVDGVQAQGVAYVFAKSGSTWGQTGKLTAFDGEFRYHFGSVTAIGGQTIVVGVPRANYGQGAAYVFNDPQGFAVTVDPASQTVNPGTTVTFTAAATGAANISAQWQLSTDGGDTWTDILGATNSWYSLYSRLVHSGNRYRAVLTNEANATVTTNPATLTVIKATPAITITPSLNPVSVGVPFVITVGVSPAGFITRPIFPGSILLKIGSVYSTYGYVADGQACFEIPPTLAVGTYTVTATYDDEDDSVFGPAVATTTLTIVRADSSVVGSVSSFHPDAPLTFAEPLILWAKVSLGNGMSPLDGVVVFYDNGVALGSASLAGAIDGVVTFNVDPLNAGDHYFQMVYMGDARTLGSASEVYHLVIQPSATTTTTLTSSRSPSTFGDSLTFTATVAGASGPVNPTSGTVQFYVGLQLVANAPVGADGKATLTTSALVPGTYMLTAVYLASDGFQASMSNRLYQTVVSNKAPTSTTLTTNRNPSSAGDVVTFTASVFDANGPIRLGAGRGAVDFYIGGVQVVSIPVDAHGQATLPTSALVPGFYTLYAVFRTVDDFQQSTSNQLIQTVGPNNTLTTTTLTSSRNPSTFGDSLTFTATVATASGPLNNPWAGVVQFFVGARLVASSPLNAASQAKLDVSALVPGVYMITAVFQPTSYYQASMSDRLFQTVQAAPAATPLTVPVTSVTPVAVAEPAVGKFQAVRAKLLAARAELFARRAQQRQRLVVASKWR